MGKVPGWSALRRELAKMGFSRRSAVIGLDFDGTLAPLARRPDLVRLPRPTRRLLGRLARTPGLRLAVLSGRRLKDVASRTGVRNIFYSGNHGFEIRGPGLSWRHPKARSGARGLKALAQEIRSRLAAFPGAFLEDKELTLCVHVREMDPRRNRALGSLLEGILGARLRGMRLSRGKKSWEIGPRLRWDKGRALLKIARPARPGKRLLFVGDDRTDEAGFRTLGRRAFTVKVGGGETAARYRLKNPAAVRRLLEFLAGVGGRQARVRTSVLPERPVSR